MAEIQQQQQHRKVRKSNFSTDEVDTLVDSVRGHFDVLYGCYAKRASNRWARHKAWLEILNKVNGVSTEKRTLQEVKNKWKKCQYAMKEKGGFNFAVEDADSDDSMPLQERLSKSTPSSSNEKQQQQQQQQNQSGNPILKSQQMSPTKLKVTRQSTRVVNKPAQTSTPIIEPPQAASPPNEEMCLRWNSHHSNMQTAFPSILHKEQYVDVTLAAEGKTLKCHRLILSSCSPYFEEILSGISPLQHPVLFMKDIPFWILKSLCDFMYAGEVHIYQNKLEELLTVAEALKIKGLAGKSTPPDQQDNKDQSKSRNSDKSNQYNRRPAQMQNYADDDNDDLLDPLDLLEPLYEEAAEEKKPPSTVTKPKEIKYHHYQPSKKPFGRKFRKRKYSEQRDPSPPPVFSFRKGTRSRPNVKIPKYYHSDYSSNETSKTVTNSQVGGDPLLEVDEIKTEPIDVEDNNLMDYSDEENQFNNVTLQDAAAGAIIITSTRTVPPQQEQPLILNNDAPENFRPIKLSKPVITEVHSIEETAQSSSGGLEVIKIATTAEVEENKALEVCNDENASAAAASGNDNDEIKETQDTEPVVNENHVHLEDNENVVNNESNQMTIHDVRTTSNEEIEEAPPDIEAENVAAPPSEEVTNNDKNDETNDAIATSLDHLEKEAMNVANALNNSTIENQGAAE